MNNKVQKFEEFRTNEIFSTVSSAVGKGAGWLKNKITGKSNNAFKIDNDDNKIGKKIKSLVQNISTSFSDNKQVKNRAFKHANDWYFFISEIEGKEYKIDVIKHLDNRGSNKNEYTISLTPILSTSNTQTDNIRKKKAFDRKGEEEKITDLVISPEKDEKDEEKEELTELLKLSNKKYELSIINTSTVLFKNLLPMELIKSEFKIKNREEEGIDIYNFIDLLEMIEFTIKKYKKSLTKEELEELEKQRNKFEKIQNLYKGTDRRNEKNEAKEKMINTLKKISEIINNSLNRKQLGDGKKETESSVALIGEQIINFSDFILESYLNLPKFDSKKTVKLNVDNLICKFIFATLKDKYEKTNPKY
jgi:hypothetical protein